MSNISLSLNNLSLAQATAVIETLQNNWPSEQFSLPSGSIGAQEIEQEQAAEPKKAAPAKKAAPKKAAPKAAEPAPEPEPEEESDLLGEDDDPLGDLLGGDDEPLTRDQVMDMAAEAIEGGQQPVLKEVLKKYKAARVTGVPDDKIAAFGADLRSALAAA